MDRNRSLHQIKITLNHKIPTKRSPLEISHMRREFICQITSLPNEIQ